MRGTTQLILDANDPRLERQPQYVRQLIAELAYRLNLEAKAAEGARRRAEKEVDEARKIAAEGPENSDTFLSMPRSFSTFSEEYEQKPLGTGVNIEFRAPGLTEGEGFQVSMEDGKIKVSGMSRLAVVPQDAYSITIEAR